MITSMHPGMIRTFQLVANYRSRPKVSLGCQPNGRTAISEAIVHCVVATLPGRAWNGETGNSHPVFGVHTKPDQQVTLHRRSCCSQQTARS